VEVIFSNISIFCKSDEYMTECIRENLILFFPKKGLIKLMILVIIKLTILVKGDGTYETN
jgi:hypothetical protein